ncbi:MAG TPA: MFS transporter [Streptosporangiaceae bacterium]|nr:MFS transporter [Streptosporangiaceae bacterium]
MPDWPHAKGPPFVIADGRPGGRSPDKAQVRGATRAVYIAFIVNGFIFASWAARIPQVRDGLRVSPGVLGLILLSVAVGSTIATPLSGLVITWLGDSRTVAVMSLTAAAGMAIVAVGFRYGIPPVAAGLFLFGFSSGTWDVAMNVQGAAVEQRLRRSIMSRFHAGWSIGTVAGAGIGAAMVALGVPVTAHLLAAALVVAAVVPIAARRFLPHARAETRRDGTAVRRSPLRAWTEPRTLLIGLFVLCMAFTEGTSNDWLSLGVIGGYHTAAALGTLTFAVFLAAMTTGRWFGPAFIDRYGRVPVLRVCAATALAGLILLEAGGVLAAGGLLAAALAGALLMGLGTSLGFPTGISAAADDPRYAPGRVSTAASIGYLAFLAGPPAIGFLADHVGVLRGLSVTGALLTVAFILCPVTAPISPSGPEPD